MQAILYGGFLSGIIFPIFSTTRTGQARKRYKDKNAMDRSIWSSCGLCLRGGHNPGSSMPRRIEVWMFSITKSGTVCGLKSREVTVETDVSNGLPGMELVGLLSSEVREAKERVRVALKNSGITMPAKRITVNLAPADLRKEGSGLDVAIAVGLLSTLGYLDPRQAEGILFLGELGLNGEIKPVKGVLPIVMGGKEWGIHTCIVPADNVAEGTAAGIRVLGMSSLSEVIHYLGLTPGEREAVKPVTGSGREIAAGQEDSGQGSAGQLDFADIGGQERAKRAAEIAAAGFHNLLMVGPPGSGKTMIAKRIPSILPELSEEESLAVTAVYSVAGQLKAGQGLVRMRPFQNPHHTVSRQALIGGGAIPKPGIISLAHRGVLFLDELAEFGRDVLEALRQPLEDKQVCVARLHGVYTYPADLMFVAAANPCPCGYYPDLSRCRCTPHEVRRYLRHISGPILDRMDLCVEVARPGIRDLECCEGRETSRSIRERVCAAQEMQRRRYEGTAFRFNGDLTDGAVREFCPLAPQELAFMEKAFHRMQLSARGYYRVIKTARTIADLDGDTAIRKAHLGEALSLRMHDMLNGET